MIHALFKNPWFKHLAKLSLSIAIVIYLVLTVDREALLSAVGQADISGIVVATALIFMGVVYIQALEIHESMKSGARIGVLNLCKINLTLMFYVLFLPAGLTFLVRWEKYRRVGYGGYDSAALVVFHKLLQLAIAGIVALAALFVLQKSPSVSSVDLESVVSSVLAGAVLVIALLVSGVPVKVLSRLSSAVSGESGRALAWVNRAASFGLKILHKAGDAFSEFGKLGLKKSLLVCFYALIQHVLIVMSGWVVLSMIVGDVSFWAVTFVRSVVVILLMVPVSVGGLGVRELAFFSLFPLFGVPSESALIASLVLFLVQIIISAIGGVVELQDFIKSRPSLG